MYALLKRYTLNEIIEFYKSKYTDHSVFRAIMSLAFFEDADKQTMPQMFIPDTWESIKAYILHEATDYQNHLH